MNTDEERAAPTGPRDGLLFSKEELIRHATAGATAGVREAAAEALYILGQRAAVAEMRSAFLATSANEQNMGIKDDKALVSLDASSPKVAPTLGSVTAPEASNFSVRP